MKCAYSTSDTTVLLHLKTWARGCGPARHRRAAAGRSCVGGARPAWPGRPRRGSRSGPAAAPRGPAGGLRTGRSRYGLPRTSWPTAAPRLSVLAGSVWRRPRITRAWPWLSAPPRAFLCRLAGCSYCEAAGCSAVSAAAPSASFGQSGRPYLPRIAAGHSTVRPDLGGSRLDLGGQNRVRDGLLAVASAACFASGSSSAAVSRAVAGSELHPFLRLRGCWAPGRGAGWAGWPGARAWAGPARGGQGWDPRRAASASAAARAPRRHHWVHGAAAASTAWGPRRAPGRWVSRLEPASAGQWERPGARRGVHCC